jgi:hypothetical protein
MTACCCWDGAIGEKMAKMPPAKWRNPTWPHSKPDLAARRLAHSLVSSLDCFVKYLRSVRILCFMITIMVLQVSDR